MDELLNEIRVGLPDRAQFIRVSFRLFAAVLLGAVMGFQRERVGKPAGLRTHMLVALGSALLVLGAAESDMDMEQMSRVVQGIATGIGFIGGGAILKLSAERDIKGLTTAAGIWLTSGVGVAVGMGRLGIALVATLLAWIILAVVVRPESSDRLS